MRQVMIYPKDDGYWVTQSHSLEAIRNIKEAVEITATIDKDSQLIQKKMDSRSEAGMTRESTLLFLSFLRNQESSLYLHCKRYLYLISERTFTPQAAGNNTPRDSTRG
ncbi:hypothetical protein [Candidatus Magnetomonas plexicatena]|uniref:hypothetical protein n=1 Tax=Candidatus Magnetomonas plexicatena TaxID=2552947 RepID=UPI001103F96E|nr:hypothetical protein E2O03_001955 [Nitrospirales bacterium LBB_01]